MASTGPDGLLRMIKVLTIFQLNLPPDPDLYLFEGNRFAGGGEGVFRRLDQSKTARDFHVGKGNALNRIGLEDLGQCFSIDLNVIQFGAADHDGLPFEKVLVEIAIGKGNTISSIE